MHRSACWILVWLGVGLTSPLLAQNSNSANPQTKGQESKQPSGSQEYIIGGKTIDEWIKDIPSKDKSRGENAIRTVMLFPPESSIRAVPVLIKELQSHSRQSLDISIRVNAINALGKILGETKDPDSKYIKDTVNILIQMLRDTQVIVRYRAAQALGSIGPEAAGSVPYLLANLQDRTTWDVRQSAAFALGMVGVNKTTGPDPKIIKALYTSLTNDTASQVRLTAIQSLTWLGPPANPQTQKLVQQALAGVAIQDPEPNIRIWAHVAIMGIDGKVDTERLNEIGKLLDNRDLNVRLEAARALMAIGLEAKSQIPRLSNSLADQEQGVVYLSILALSRMGRWAKTTIPRLQYLQKNENYTPEVRRAAEDAISKIEGKTQSK